MQQETRNLKIKSFKFQVSSFKLRQGFGLIEFMIVITVFGIATAVITASFLTFERNQRLKSAASMLKNDIRLAQNKALAGDKGPAAECAVTSTLVGWYLKIDTGSGNKSYTIAGDCKDASGTENTFNSKIVYLPRKVIIFGVSCGVFIDGAYGTIFYQPLIYNASFHNNLAPIFFDSSSGNLTNILCTGNDLVITLQAEQGTNTYQVIVSPSGEVNEQK